ncbi:sensor histidine kinase [Pseudoflavonifractor phocaeensis]|uniref:sensor histidine kinase n=1 Tax=Pseudoflavonifractor phocaeensis TaxID=1870988 RepID=UPI0019567B77|nr:HAMP domain-containing sensor histidine kinase [Pseudoflavonifractor phocaeensis]MBM6886407.1 GHKL domain-containing protein [Pseudoflavonifractor phocaeensis]
MIRTLRRRFLLIALASLTGTLAVLCLVINLGYHAITTRRADQVLQMLHQNAGQFPEPETQADPGAFPGFQVTLETPFETRYVVVRLTGQREVAEVDMEHIAALDREKVIQQVEQILDGGKSSGYSGYYRYQVFDDGEEGQTIVVLDCFLQLQAANNVLRLTLLASLACIAIVFLLLVFLSRRVVRPFAENLEKQRRFVTDASHELKTPLAIISANTGLLEASLGENRWLASTQVQVSRLDRLIGHLVELARTEEALTEEELQPVDLSGAVTGQMEDYRLLAQTSGKELESDVAPGVTVRGAADNLKRLCTLLLDNAVKYCDSGGTIRLTLAQRGRWAVLSIANPCAGLDPAQLPRLFDRFYRADASRSRDTGGYGIGLSTARAIVQRHRGRLTAKSEDGLVVFTARLPLT